MTEAEQERARIVAFVRKQIVPTADEHSFREAFNEAYREIADAIERLDHHKQEEQS